MLAEPKRKLAAKREPCSSEAREQQAPAQTTAIDRGRIRHRSGAIRRSGRSDDDRGVSGECSALSCCLPATLMDEDQSVSRALWQRITGHALTVAPRGPRSNAHNTVSATPSGLVHEFFGTNVLCFQNGAEKNRKRDSPVAHRDCALIRLIIEGIALDARSLSAPVDGFGTHHSILDLRVWNSRVVRVDGTRFFEHFGIPLSVSLTGMPESRRSGRDDLSQGLPSHARASSHKPACGRLNRTREPARPRRQPIPRSRRRWWKP